MSELGDPRQGGGGSNLPPQWPPDRRTLSRVSETDTTDFGVVLGG